MHLANASSAAAWLSPGAVETELTEPATLADVSVAELPPHPASRPPVVSVTTASRRSCETRCGRLL
jgi:hypothetical protein